jgi:hypothetical protein
LNKSTNEPAIAELDDFIELLQQLEPDDMARLQRLVDLVATAPSELQGYAAALIAARPAPADCDAARERVNAVIAYLESRRAN